MIPVEFGAWDKVDGSGDEFILNELIDIDTVVIRLGWTAFT